MDEYSVMAILIEHIWWTKGVVSRGNGIHSEKYYSIYLMDKTQRGRMLVKRFQDLEEAKKEAIVLSNRLGVLFTAFNPPPALSCRR